MDGRCSHMKLVAQRLLGKQCCNKKVVKNNYLLACITMKLNLKISRWL